MSKKVGTSRNYVALVRVAVLVTMLAPLVNGPAQPLVRMPNTTLTLPQQPATLGFIFVDAFPGATVSTPMGFAVPPGETNRLFIMERAGRIVVITNLAAPTRTLFLDISPIPTNLENGLLGMAFHPGYATNRHFFIYHSANMATAAGSGLHQRVVRFTTRADNPNAADPSSLTPIINQYDEASNHNGGDIHFGPDGYLYIAVGDEGGGNDSWDNARYIDKDLHAGILRIDVDRRAGNLPPNPHPAATTNYMIPADNPFVGITNFTGSPVDPNKVRTEFWAVGLRNPWRMSFDSATGDLYCGDVGQGAREEVNLIVRGGHYGWPYLEGTRPGPRGAPGGFSSIPPIHEYSHCTTCSASTQAGNSITGGVLYRGSRLSQLAGKYVFSDYVSGHTWALSPAGTNVVPKQHLLTDPSIVSFGIDPSNGDILAADHGGSIIKRLTYNAVSTGSPLPPTLADTGAFSDTASLIPNPGIVPYDINVPFWSDGADKQRWFSIPDINHKIGFSAQGNWQFPTGTVWIKHFEMEMTNGVPESRKRLETRFLVRNTDGIYGATYRWGDSRTNATLVAEEGLAEPLVLNRGGVLSTQVWHYPSRADCQTCHTPQAGYALGFNTAQLNREWTPNQSASNQISVLSHAGYFSSPVTNHVLPAMAPPKDATASLEIRSRSWLSVNCAQCHVPGGPAPAGWDARFATPTEDMGIINAPALNDLGNPQNRLIKPGAPSNSVILSRINTHGPLRMPPLASSVIDSEGVQLLSAWITNDLPAYQTFAEWQTDRFGSTNSPAAAPDANLDYDASPNLLEFLAGKSPSDPNSEWRPALVLSNGRPTIVVDQPANRAIEVQVSQGLPAQWSTLNVPENRPFFPASNRFWSIPVPDPLLTNSFYRARLIAP
jgi:uncharacterized repeat protein (TIGR03806 family)